jgi:hypothetical protein
MHRDQPQIVEISLLRDFDGGAYSTREDSPEVHINISSSEK